MSNLWHLLPDTHKYNTLIARPSYHPLKVDLMCRVVDALNVVLTLTSKIAYLLSGGQ